MDNLKNFAKLNTLKKDEIKAQNIPLRDLWLIKDPSNKVFGPFKTSQIQKECHEKPETFKNIQACNMQDEKWYEVYRIKSFQRRRDEVGKTNIDPNQKIYVMLNGQKNGPYTVEETQKLLANGHIEYSTQISMDMGDTWVKLWNHPSFDRRSQKTNEELPFLPSNDVLELVSKTKDEILNTYDSEDPILELAYIGHNKSEKEKNTPPKVPSSDDIPKFEEEDFEADNKGSSKLKYVYAFSVVAILATVGIFFASTLETKSIVADKVESKELKSTTKKRERTPASRNTTRRTVKKIKPKTYRKPSTARRRPSPSRARVNRNNRNLRLQANDRRMRLEQEAERLNINDPAFQEEISRKISSDYDMDERDDNYPQDDPYPREDLPMPEDDRMERAQEPLMDNAPYQDEQDPYNEPIEEDYPEDY